MIQFIMMTKTSNEPDWSIQLFQSLTALMESLRFQIRRQYFTSCEIDYSIGCDELLDRLEDDFIVQLYEYDGQVSTPINPPFKDLS